MAENLWNACFTAILGTLEYFCVVPVEGQKKVYKGRGVLLVCIDVGNVFLRFGLLNS